MVACHTERARSGAAASGLCTKKSAEFKMRERDNEGEREGGAAFWRCCSRWNLDLPRNKAAVFLIKVQGRPALNAAPAKGSRKGEDNRKR